MVEKFEQLKQIVSDMIEKAGSGHFASSISALEIMVPLFYEQRIDPSTFILSKGHAAPALYAILFDLGYLKQSDLDKFREYGGLPGHPELTVNGVLCSSGSLGMGISKAVGLAHANSEKIYHVLVGDGELQEGQNWEAILYIIANEIKNIRVHVDMNGHQYSGVIPENLRISDYDAWPGWIEFYSTHWDHDNSYLTKPKEKDVTYPWALYDAMESDSRIIALNADLEQDFLLTPIKGLLPDRYIQCGISEQHMVSMANGLALAGKMPICHTFAAFYLRAFEQMRNNACDGLHIGYVAGLSKKGSVNIGRSHEASNKRLFKYIGVEPVNNIGEFFNALSREQWRGVYLEV